MYISQNLIKLKKSNSINDLVNYFKLEKVGITAKNFGYLVYGIPNSDNKYTTFSILKANGKTRTIHAPNKFLKHIQKQFSQIFLDCIQEIQQDNPNYLLCNHAFEKNKSIVSNAQKHQHKQFVLNVDISNFFETINYGRIYAFLRKDKYFQLNDNTAKIIAALACHHGKLPQGSPLSPILASLIGNLIDVRMIQLAKKYRLTYTRYADDLTFSSNKALPDELIYWDDSYKRWVAGDVLVQAINKTGFQINPEKTRYSKSSSRQIVTGLVVNKYVNVNQQYKKVNRAMVYSLLKTGKFQITKNGQQCDGTIPQLIGRLYYTIYAKYFQLDNYLNSLSYSDKNIYKKDGKDNEKMDHQVKLLRNVLFYHHFININQTVIFPEGLTDSTYFQLAAKALNIENYKFQKINNSLKILGLTGGVPTINNFFQNINKQEFINFDLIKKESKHPAIFVLDYDQGLESLNYLRSRIAENMRFLHVDRNIYILFLRKFDIKKEVNIAKFFKENPSKKCCIENLLKSQGEAIQTTGKDNDKIIFEDRERSKMEFVRYVAQYSKKFDFSEFRELFMLVKDIEKHYFDEVFNRDSI